MIPAHVGSGAEKGESSDKSGENGAICSAHQNPLRQIS